MFVAASTRCFADKSFAEACFLLDDLEYDKVELWFDETRDHLKPSTVIHDPEAFYNRFREATRLTPVAFCLETDIDLDGFRVLSKLAKQFRMTQITLPASRLGTPFNAEIDRLRAFLKVGNQDGILISIKTQIGRLTEDPNTAIELCQAAPGLGLTLDPSHYLCGPHASEEFEQVYPHVYHVHLRDSAPGQFQVPIGLGQIEYSRLITHLRRFRYTRALSVEILPELLNEIDRPIELRKMRRLLESQL